MHTCLVRAHRKSWHILYVVCMEDTRHMSIHGKQCYMGYHYFLEAGHPWRAMKEFDGTVEVRSPPRRFDYSDIVAQLESLSTQKPGKGQCNSSRKRKRLTSELNWLKKSILFKLSYWSTLKL